MNVALISRGTVNDESLGRRCPPGERAPQASFDALLPSHMAERAEEEAGARKAALDLLGSQS